MDENVGTAVWTRVVREQERADNSSEFARRHEAVADTDPVRGSAFHHRMAAVHRLSERRHMAMADLYCSNALQHVAGFPEPSGGMAGPKHIPMAAQSAALAEVAALAGARAAVLSTVDAEHFQPYVAASERRALRAEDMEFILGEGPVRDVLTSRGSVAVDGENLESRWPAYGPELRALGYHSVTAVPLYLHTILVGALVFLELNQTLDGERQLAVKHLGNVLVRVLRTSGSTSGAGERRTDIVQAAEVIALYYGSTLDDAIAIIRTRALAEHRRVDNVLRAMLEECTSDTRRIPPVR